MRLSRESQSFSFKAYISKVDGFGEQNSGTTLVKYSPTVGKEEITRREDVIYHSISFIKEYADKSLEELRLEDYKAGRVSKESALGNFIYKFNTAPASNTKSPVKKTGALLAYEVLSKRFDTKLFIPKKKCVAGEPSSGTALVKYSPEIGLEVVEKAGNISNVTVTYLCITLMKEYENKSLEELRLEDYRAGRNLLIKYIRDFFYKPKIYVFGFKNNYAFSFREKGRIDKQSKGSAIVKYSPTVGLEEIKSVYFSHNMNIVYNFITAMKEYQNKSLEELRFEDYTAGRTHGGEEGSIQAEPLVTSVASGIDILKFHMVHGKNVSLSNDGTTVERTNSHNDGVAYSSRPILVDEVVYLHLVEIWTRWLTLSGIHFGFTTENPSGIPGSFVPKYATTTKNSWIITLNKNLCAKDNIIHFHVDSTGEMRFGVNGQIQDCILTGVDISRPLWAVVDVFGRCKKIQFVGPEALSKLSHLQALEEAKSSNQSELEEGARRPEQVADGASSSNQSQLEEGARRPEQVVDVARSSNQSQLEEGARRPEQVADVARSSNQSQLEEGTRRPEQVADVARSSNQSQLEKEARRPEQVADGARSSSQSQLEEGTRRPEQVADGARSSSQSQLEEGTRRPEQVADGARSSSQSQLEEGARRLDQVADGDRSSNQSGLKDKPVNQLRSPLAVVGSLVPLSLHKTKGRNIYLTSRGVVARYENKYWQGYVFTAQPMRPGTTITAQIISRDNSYSRSLTIGLTSCDPATLDPDELPDDAKFLQDRPEYWIVHPNAADRFDKGDELNLTLSLDGKLEVCKNGSNPVDVFQVDRTLKLWAFFDICGATKKVRLLMSKLVRRSGQVEVEARHVSQSQVEDEAIRPELTVDRPRCSNQNQLEDGAVHPELAVDRPRRSNQSQVEDDPLLDQLRSLSVVERSPVPRHKNPVPLSLHRTKGRNIHFTGTGVAARYEGEYCQGYVFTAQPMHPGTTITAQILHTENSYSRSLTFGLTSCDPATLDPDELPDDAKFLQDRPEYWIVHPNAADRFDIGDELNLTLTVDGKLEVCKNGSNPVEVFHIDNTLRLWAFFDIYGATEEVRLFKSELVRCPDQGVDGGGRSNQIVGARRPDQVVNGARLAQVVNGAGRSNQVVNGAGRSNQVVNGARRPDRVVDRAGRSNQVVNGARPAQVVDGAGRSNQIVGARRPDQVMGGAGRSIQIVEARRPDQTSDRARREQAPRHTSKGNQNSANTNTKRTIETMPSTSKNQEPKKMECTICFDSQINCAIYKCGHMCMCYDCAIQMWKNEGRAFGKCPICRAKIEDVIRTYL